MILNLKNTILLVVAGLLCFGAATTASGHELKNNTARVELRDNHFRILLNVAILDWLSQVGPHNKGQKAVFDETQIATKLEQAQNDLLQETRLWGDETQAKLKILHFPKPEDIRQLLIQFTEIRERRAKLPHGFGWWNIQLEGIFDAEPPSSVSASFPESLGELSITFSQPSSRQVVPGARASFQVFGPAHNSDENTDILAWILVALLSLALLGRYFLKPSPNQEI